MGTVPEQWGLRALCWRECRHSCENCRSKQEPAKCCSCTARNLKENRSVTDRTSSPFLATAKFPILATEAKFQLYLRHNGVHDTVSILMIPERSLVNGVRVAIERSTGCRHGRKAGHGDLHVVFPAGNGHRASTDRDALKGRVMCMAIFQSLSNLSVVSTPLARYSSKTCERSLRRGV